MPSLHTMSGRALPSSSLLVVTGGCWRAEDADRPMAYALRDWIRPHWSGPVVVVNDVRFLQEPKWHDQPCITIGGPLVNQVTERWLGELPPVLEVEEEFLVQMTDDDWPPPVRASVWGMHQELTQLALETFRRHYLEPFLARSVLCPSVSMA